jgi:hypothetical protein
MLLEAPVQLEELKARHRITDIIHAYCLHVDRNEPKQVAALFSADCVVDYGPGLGGPINGKETLAAALEPGLARFEATHHQVSNIQLSFESRNRVTGITYVTAWHRFPGDAPDATLYAQYHDVFVRKHGQWEIAERRLRASGQIGFDIEWTPIGRH